MWHACRIQFPNQGSNPGPLHWECGVLPPGHERSPRKVASDQTPERNCRMYWLDGGLGARQRVNLCSAFSSITFQLWDLWQSYLNFKLPVASYDFCFKRTLFFRAVSGLQQNPGEGTEFLYTRCPHMPLASPIISIPDQSGTCVMADEATLIHHHHSKSIVYSRVHTSCCTF